MNIIKCIYNHFIVSHPIYVLCCYILAYILLSAYMFKLVGVLSNKDKMPKDPMDGEVLPTNWLEEGTTRKHCHPSTRMSTQTRKSTPGRFQKGNYKHVRREVFRGSKTRRKRRPPRPFGKQTYKRVGIKSRYDSATWMSEYMRESWLEHDSSAFFQYICDKYPHYLDIVMHGMEVIKVGENRWDEDEYESKCVSVFSQNNKPWLENNIIYDDNDFNYAFTALDDDLFVPQGIMGINKMEYR